ncbi:hypothetical protein [Nisaea sp.]|uniref:hypothetical protein n=1 Tax=Nisaea sp. TaxID=2024842 RepID=UPI003265481C
MGFAIAPQDARSFPIRVQVFDNTYLIVIGFEREKGRVTMYAVILEEICAQYCAHMFDFLKNISIKSINCLILRQAHNLKVVGSNPTPATNINAANLLSWRRFDSPVFIVAKRSGTTWVSLGIKLKPRS